MTDKWETKHIECSVDEAEAALNTLGAEGWEPYAVVAQTLHDASIHWLVWLKRKAE